MTAITVLWLEVPETTIFYQFDNPDNETEEILLNCNGQYINTVGSNESIDKFSKMIDSWVSQGVAYKVEEDQLPYAFKTSVWVHCGLIL